MSINTFDNIFDDNTNLHTNPTINGATSLVEKAKNSAVRTKQFRNVGFPKSYTTSTKKQTRLKKHKLQQGGHHPAGF